MSGRERREEGTENEDNRSDAEYQQEKDATVGAVEEEETGGLGGSGKE